jgi:hypothetical protein
MALSQKNYEALARIVGNAMEAARQHGGEDAYAVQYENLFCPLSDYLAADNPLFDRTRFAYATATAMNREPS